MNNMPVRLQILDDQITAYLSGEIDHHTAAPMREEIDETAQRVQPKLLILDFSGVTFMDSSGIGLVMGRYRLMQELQIARIPRPLRRVMQVAGLSKLTNLDDGGDSHENQ
jgi:stage II sporulation protein AA (anti-sigma F factor antagonist)